MSKKRGLTFKKEWVKMSRYLKEVGMFQIACVMVSGRPLDFGIAELLRKSAIIMFREGRDKGRINKKDASGLIKTERKRQRMGSYIGIRFDAEIETEGGKSKVSFLIPQHNLESQEAIEGWWFSHEVGREQTRPWLN